MNTDVIVQAILKLNNILLGAAKKSCFVKRSKVQSKHKIHQTQDWFTKECRDRRTLLRRYSKDLSNNPFDKRKRKKILDARNAYKKVCRKSEKAYRPNKLMEIGQGDPKMFWSIVNKMNNWGKKTGRPSRKYIP